MKTSQLLRFFDDQTRAIAAPVDQLDQIQMAFNARLTNSRPSTTPRWAA